MDDGPPPLPNYQDWVTKTQYAHEDDCTCQACYHFHVYDDRILLGLVWNDREYDKYRDEAVARWNRDCPLRAARRAAMPKPKHHTGNGAPKGTWAGTLTMAPTDPTNEAEMITAIQKIMSQRTCPVQKYAWYLEYTENAMPHIHFIYQTPGGGRIHQKVFKRLWPIWDEATNVGRGHRGGYHRIVHDTEAYLTYIKKDGGVHASSW